MTSHRATDLYRRMRVEGWCIVVAAAACGISAMAVAQCQYAIVGPLIQGPNCPFTGPATTHVRGMNSKGWVAGYYIDCEFSWINHAFIWKPGQGMTTLPKPPDVVSSFASGVNDDGWVIGGHTFVGVGNRAFIFNPATQEYTYLEPLHPGASATDLTVASAINNDLVIVGSRVISEPGEPIIRNAVIWLPFGEDGEGEEIIIDLPVMDGPSSRAEDGNAGTDAVGWSGSSVLSPTAKAWIWTEGIAIDLGVLPGTIQSSARALNDSLEALGACRTPEGPFLAFHWKKGAMNEFKPPRGHVASGPVQLSNIGQIVGGMLPKGDAFHHAYVWQHGVFHDLNQLTLNLPGNLHLNAGAVVRDDGAILAKGLIGSKIVGVLLSPVGSPPGDVNLDCAVDLNDLLYLLSQWGKPGSNADLNGNGTVGVADLLILLSNWSP